MSDPTKYFPSYNFTGYQTINPTAPLPAPQVDTQFNNISTALSQTIDGLMDIRRSDGKLKNGIVGPDAISPALNIGFTQGGQWAAGVNYQAGDGIVYATKFYTCRVSHLSTNANRPDLDSATWAYLFQVSDLVVSGALSFQTVTYVGDGTTKTFALPIAPASVNNLWAKVGTTVQSVSAYTVSGTSVTLTVAPGIGVPVEFRVLATIAVAELEAAVYTARDTAVTKAGEASASATAAAGSASAASGSASAAAATAASMLPNPPTDGYTYGRDTSTWVRLPTNAPGGEWKYSTTTSVPPATGEVRLSNVVLASAATMYLSKTDSAGIDRTSMLAMICQPGVDLFIGSENAEARWAVFTVTGLPTDVAGSPGYYSVPVVFKSAGTALVDADFSRVGPLGGAGSKVVTDDAPPSGPLDGQQWWRSSNGKMYVFYDDGSGGGQWVEASGTLGNGTQGVNLAGYSVQVSNSALQNIAASTLAKVTNLGTVDHDPSGFWSVANQKFQPTKAGLYLIEGKATITLDDGAQLAVLLEKNGNVHALLGRGTAGSAGQLGGFGGGVIVPMNGTTDYLEMWVRHTNAAATNLIGDPNTEPRYTSFSAAFLGEAGIPQPTTRTALQQNLIVNPAMQVSQENDVTASGTNAYYAADQWAAFFSTSTGVLSFGRVVSKTPRGSKYRLRLSVTTADTSVAAGEACSMVQKLEGARLANLGWNGATGAQLVLRFGFRAPAGTYSIAYNNAALNRSWVSNFTITAGQANTDVEITKIIPPDNTGGAWPDTTALGAQIAIGVMAGSTYTGTPDAWTTGQFIGGTGASNGLATAGNTFELFDVGLYPDPDNSGAAPAWVAPKFDEVLREGQRYFAQTLSSTRFIAVSVGAPNSSNITWPVQMRAAPTTSRSGGSVTNSTPSIVASSTIGARMDITSTAAGDCYALDQLITANARM